MRTYVSGAERLRRLPEVFSVNTLGLLMNIPKPTALVYLSRWRAKAWVEPAGPRCGVYFNLVRNPQSTREHRALALLMEYPGATLMGASVLHAFGWTTQIPTRMHVAVERRRIYVQFTGFDLHPKSLEWFRTVAYAKAKGAYIPIYGLRAITPAWALADLFETPNAWHPESDDLDVPQRYETSIVKARNFLRALRRHAS
jgi:hypothetical protein